MGKAKNLKNRVKSYFKFSPTLSVANKLSPRINKMISECNDLEYIVASNQYDALILENSLIKELKPKYNILLRDDKTYPYIALDLREKFPRFEITRKIENNSKIKYFGPFSSSAREILNALYLCYKLVQKKSCVKGKKSCLYYQIDRCHAPCVDKITQEEYMKIVNEAKSCIIDRKKLINKLNEKMIKASEDLNFEEAANLRDMQNAIKNTLHVIQLDLAKIENFDLISIEIEKTLASFVYLFIRDGKVVSSIKKVTKNSMEYEINELYKRAILQFYKTNIQTTPKNIYVAYEFEEMKEVSEYFKQKFDKNIEIKNPKRGEKLSLCKVASNNAKDNLKSYKQNHQNDITEEIRSFFDLQNTPVRIEAFDNSHHSGDAPIGSMITYEEGKFIKEDYRIYNLSTKDEYSQMKELLSRRIEKFKENSAPDLWVIDGGDTLLKLAKKLLDEVGVYIDLIAISKEKRDAKAQRAKGRAKDIIYTSTLSYKLPTSEKKLHFIQKLRDEAHRFAIKSHRNKKVKNDMNFNLLEVTGVGEATIKKLLSYFGSFDNIYNASKSELESIVSKQCANSIYSYIKE